MKVNKLMLTVLSAAVISSGFGQTGEVFAHEKPAVTQKAHDHYYKFTEQKAAKAAGEWAAKMSYVQSGGDYSKGGYKTFTYKGMTYRYLSKDINTKKELLAYLEKTATRSLAEKLIKDMGIIEYHGKLAQPEADGGSLLDWSKAKAYHLKSYGHKKTYKVVVPIGDTKSKSVYFLQMKKHPHHGWKVDELTFKRDISYHH